MNVVATVKGKAEPTAEPETKLENEQYRTDGKDLYFLLSVGEERTWVEDARTGATTELGNHTVAKWRVIKRGK